MCGVLLQFEKSKNIDLKKFKEALELMEYRGPDNQSIVFYDDLDKEPRVYNGEKQKNNVSLAIGHNRLSIFDLSDNSNQPMLDRNTNKFLAYNGEFYNFSDFSKDVSEKSDARVLFRQLCQHPTSIFNHVNGMWASVFGDINDKKLYLSRDRYGKKPLYYFQDSNQFIISSEIKSIFHLIESKRHVNATMLGRFIYGKLSPFPIESMTFYENIHSVRPGVNLVYDLKIGTLKKHSDVRWHELDSIDCFSMPEKELEEQMSHELYDSVRLRMKADVDVAILVSGGVDSSFILGVANKISDKSKLNLYTCHIYDKLGNLSADTQHSRNIASRLGLPLTEVKTESHTEDSLLNTLEILTRYSEIPVHYLLSTIPTFQLAQCMHENGIKVCLDGTGGDEIMGGYPSSGSLAIANAVMRRPLSTMSHYSDWFMSSNSTFNEKIYFFLRLAKKSLFNYKQHQLQNYPISSSLGLLSNKKLIKEIYKISHSDFIRNNMCSIGERQLYEIKNYNLPFYLGTADQFSMANSIENRAPFLDYRLIKYLGMKNKYKVRNGYNKYLLRRLIPNSIGNDVAWRKDKSGIGLSFKNRDIFSSSSLDYILDSKFVRELITTDSFKKDFEKEKVFFRCMLSLAVLDHKYQISM